MIFTSEVLINEVYTGPGKKYLSLLPTVAFAGIVPQVVALWHSTAQQLTEWENHRHQTSYDRSLILKMFSLNAIVAFGTLTLTAYIYIPFGSLLVPQITQFLDRQPVTKQTIRQNADARALSSFSINADRLTNTLFALSTTTQMIGAVTEIVIPFVKRFVSNKVEERAEAKGNQKDSSDDPAEHVFLERIRQEASLPQYDTFLDYAEMTQQFGYVCMWSVAWPLCSLAALVNNFVELRGDALKICTNMRRAPPARVESIGPWLDAISFITWVGAITNASLIYLFQPHDTSASIGHSVLHKVTTLIHKTSTANVTEVAEIPFHTTHIYAASQQPGSSYVNIRTTLFTALLVGLASQQLHHLARSGAQHIFTNCSGTTQKRRQHFKPEKAS